MENELLEQAAGPRVDGLRRTGGGGGREEKTSAVIVATVNVVMRSYPGIA